MSAEELMFLNCGVGEVSLDCKEIQPGHPKRDQSWVFIGREVMTNLDNIFKSRDITLPTKIHLVKVWFFQWSYMDVRVGL